MPKWPSLNYQLEAYSERWAQNVQSLEIKEMGGEEGLPSKRGSSTRAVCLVRAVLLEWGEAGMKGGDCREVSQTFQKNRRNGRRVKMNSDGHYL